MVNNPFISDSKTTHVKSISKSFLIQQYKKEFGVDVTEVLSSCEKVDIYECQESGFRFYHPFTIAGDSNFYEQLQQFDWYYMPWKWEHEMLSKRVKENDHILEVGCGQGAFLKKISDDFKSVNCVGLELNESAVFKSPNCEVINAFIEDFSEDNSGKYDIVCSFQVLEHISQVDSFLTASIKCLKEGGLLTIGVPNNDAFIKYNQKDILNMPPHHMCLWTERSLKAIASKYNLELIEMQFEPLQEHHFSYYTRLTLERFLGKTLSKIPMKLITMFNLKKSIEKYLSRKSDKINGHTILATYRKLN